jgi:hypothetical protein
VALPKRLGRKGIPFLLLRLSILLLLLAALSCAAPPPVTWDTVALTEGNVLTVKASAPEGLIPALFNDERRLHHIFNSQVPPSYDPERPSFMVFADSEVVHASDNINFSIRIPLVTFQPPRDTEPVYYDIEGVRICYVETPEGVSREWWDDWRNGHCHYVLNQ